MAGWCFRRGRDKATARERGFSEQGKKDLKTKRPSQKNQPSLFSERSEQTISDRREPTKINGRARLNPCLSRQFATVEMSGSIRVICAAECGSEWSGRKMSSQAAGTGRTVPILGAQHKCRLGEAWDILLNLAGRSLAAFGHTAGSVTDLTQPRNAETRFRRRTAR